MAKAKESAFTKEDVACVLFELGFTVTEEQLEVVHGYLFQVIKWNKVMNLIGPYSWRDALTLLLVDSLHLAGFIEELNLPDEPVTWDFGAGAGLPGIPLRAIWQKGQYYLVEVREKRTLFMDQFLARYDVPRTAVYSGKVEDFMAEHEPADLLVSRAFMPWEKLLELVSPNLHERSRVIILAIEKPPASLLEGKTNWRLEKHMEYTVGKDKRYFWSLLASNAPS